MSNIVKHSGMIDPAHWQMLKEQATILVKSGMLPASVKTPEAAIAIMLKGNELSMPPMQSFAHINIIQGKPTLSPEGMLAQIWRVIPGAIVDFIRLEDDYCEIRAARPGRPPTIFKYSREDADKAGLSSKDNWKKYPRAMHRSRCVSEMARTIFPDAIAGCSYTPDEINPDLAVSLDDSGAMVIDVPPTPWPPVIFNRDSDEHKSKIKQLIEQSNVAEDSCDDAMSAILTALHGKEIVAGMMSGALAQWAATQQQ